MPSAFTVADQTNAPRLLLAVLDPDQVVGSELMSVLAMGLPCIDCGGGHTAQDVLLAGHCLQVMGVYAASIPTEVIELESTWDGAVDLLP